MKIIEPYSAVLSSLLIFASLVLINDAVAQTDEVVEATVSKLQSLGAEKVHLISGEISYLNLAKSKFNDAHCPLIDNEQSLVFLSLSDTQISDISLETISKSSELKWLLLDGTKISDEGCRSLHSLSNLRLLSVKDTSVSDKSFGAKEAYWPKLRTLNISNTQVTDAVTESLQKLPSLAVLSIRGTQITDIGIKQISEIDTLASLDVSPSVPT